MNDTTQTDGKPRVQRAAPKEPTLDNIAEIGDATLAEYGLSELPVAFAMRDGNGLIQEREPCYLCLADGFYGRGQAGTWYQEGSIIVSEMIPNEHLQPLNRAGGLNFVRWLKSLPQNRAFIDIGDMAEAAQMLAKDPQVTDLPPVQYQQAVIKLAEAIKLKREGKDARTLPALGHNFMQPRSNAAPMLGAKLSDMAQRRPGETRTQGQAPAGQGGVRLANPTVPPFAASPSPH